MLQQRLTDATVRKSKAEQDAESAKREIAIVSKYLEESKPVQGFYKSLSAIESIQAAAKAQHGSNRQIVIDIMMRHREPMTNAQIAKVAHNEGTIKSKKGYKGVYATIATVLARGKNVFVNLNGQWDLKERRLKPSVGPF